MSQPKTKTTREMQLHAWLPFICDECTAQKAALAPRTNKLFILHVQAA
jgi:hypothetical protein